jgi:ubiquitin-activating enzyme E1
LGSYDRSTIAKKTKCKAKLFTFRKIFCDFGKQFEVVDVNGQNPLSTMICSITNDAHGIVTTLDEARHGFEDGSFVKFDEVKGMTEVNGREFKIKVLGPYQFSIGDASAFGAYKSCGVAEEVKKPKIIDFVGFYYGSSQECFRPSD